SDGFLLSARQLAIELVGDGSSNFAFHSNDIIECAIIAFRPKMLVRYSTDQLDIHVNRVRDSLHTALKNVRCAKLLRDVAQIGSFAAILLRRRSRDYF